MTANASDPTPSLDTLGAARATALAARTAAEVALNTAIAALPQYAAMKAARDAFAKADAAWIAAQRAAGVLPAVVVPVRPARRTLKIPPKAAPAAPAAK